MDMQYFCTKSSLYAYSYDIIGDNNVSLQTVSSDGLTISKTFSDIHIQQQCLNLTWNTYTNIFDAHIDGLVQERRNSIANTLELRLSCTNSLRHMLFFSNTCPGTDQPFISKHVPLN